MIKSEKINFRASVYPPNPKEVSYWIDLNLDPDGNIIKSYRPSLNKWVPLNTGASADQQQYIKQIVDAVGLDYLIDYEIISLPSLDSNEYFKGSTIVSAINTGDSAIKNEIIILNNKVVAINNDLQDFKSQKGVPNGLATLDDTGRIPSSQLPSGVGSGLILGDTPGTAFEGSRGKNLEIALEEMTTSLQWERI